MFELSIIRKYLIPKRKQLSVTLISLMSVGVIALVVWLVLVFLSVTEGIERGWLDKLTSLNAPLRITPTETYYSSYYSQVDAFSHASDYHLKSIGQKRDAPHSDPYDAESDPELPLCISTPDLAADGALKDPVKSVFQILEKMKQTTPGFAFQEYEISGAMLRLTLLRQEAFTSSSFREGSQSQSFLTQVSYLASFADESPYMRSLVLPPTSKDINHLFYLSNLITRDTTSFQETVKSLFPYLSLHTLKTQGRFWRIPYTLLPPGEEFTSAAHFKEGKITHLTFPLERSISSTSEETLQGVFKHEKGILTFNQSPISSSLPLFIEGSIEFNAAFIPSSLKTAQQIKEIRFSVAGSLQGHKIEGELPWENLEISKANTRTAFNIAPNPSPFWAYYIKESQKEILPELPSHEQGILLAKSFQENGVKIGDAGYLSYQAGTPSGSQEQRLPVYVAGFYDSGIMSVGSKCILVPKTIAHTINAASQVHHFDKTLANGIQVWFKSPKDAQLYRHKLETEFQKQGIEVYWKITTYEEYDFAKDLIQQFQSDRYLFTLIGIIILTVACCNIISLLVILVNDKKKEIGILQAMGASPSSIAFIFGGCGALMGLLSSGIGIVAALITLKNLDSLVHFLSMLQGHAAFNSVFYGTALPNTVSHEALYFVLIATPLISLLAGLVPAIKACRLRPSEILRSE